MSRPMGHPESAPLSHSLVPSGWRSPLGTEAVLPCPVLHGVGVRRCPGPAWDSRPHPHPKPCFCAIVRALRVICACAEDYYRARETALQPARRRYVSPRRMPL